MRIRVDAKFYVEFRGLFMMRMREIEHDDFRTDRSLICRRKDTTQTKPAVLNHKAEAYWSRDHARPNPHSTWSVGVIFVSTVSMVLYLIKN